VMHNIMTKYLLCGKLILLTNLYNYS
jgi:hypothetical protein